MAISVEWDIDIPSWRSLLQGCDGATFFHAPGWYQTHAEIDGGGFQAVRFRWSDGVEALLPLALRPRFRGWVQEALAGVENGYGGLASPHPLPPHRIQEAYEQVRARYPNLRVLGNPLARQLCVPTSGVVHETFTQALPILEPSAQRARMSEMRRRNYRKAERAGFELTRIHPVVPSDARDLYPLYAAHSSRWTYRRWVRDEAYFRTLFRHAGHDLTLFMAHRQGEAAGFVLLGSWGKTLVELHLATLPSMDSLQVGTLLIAKPLEWAYEAGYQVFDFLPSGKLDGIIAYKASFGADPLRQVEVIQEDRRSRMLAFLRGSMGRQPSPASLPQS